MANLHLLDEPVTLTRRQLAEALYREHAWDYGLRTKRDFEEVDPVRRRGLELKADRLVSMAHQAGKKR